VRWLDEDPEVEAARERYRQSQPNGHEPNGKQEPPDPPPDETFTFTVASSLAGLEPPERPWLVRVGCPAVR